MLRRLLVFVLALGLAACSGLPLNAVPPAIRLADVEIRSLGLFEQRFDVGLRIDNRNDFDLRIEALDFELEVNGRPLATGLTRVTTLIPAVSSTVLRVDAVTQSKHLIRQIRSLAPETLKEGWPYRIRGRVKTDRSSVWLPFEHAGVYGGEAKKPRASTI